MSVPRPDGLPGRLRQPGEARLRNNLNQAAPGLALGRSKYLRPTPSAGSAARRFALPGIVVVEHGDDGTVARPDADLVRWVGAATPENGVVYDDWYPETI